MGRLDGRVALVTGGNSGIGLAAARRFVADGAYVFITGRRKEELDTAVAEIGRNVSAIQGDVSKLSDLDHVIAVCTPPSALRAPRLPPARAGWQPARAWR